MAQTFRNEDVLCAATRKIWPDNANIKNSKRSELSKYQLCARLRCFTIWTVHHSSSVVHSIIQSLRSSLVIHNFTTRQYEVLSSGIGRNSCGYSGFKAYCSSHWRCKGHGGVQQVLWHSWQARPQTCLHATAWVVPFLCIVQVSIRSCYWHSYRA